MTFIVYSKPNCGFCDQTKSLLTQKGLTYEEIILDVGQAKTESTTYISRDALLAAIPSARTMPQIVKRDNNQETYIGGFTELRSHLS